MSPARQATQGHTVGTRRARRRRSAGRRARRSPTTGSARGPETSGPRTAWSGTEGFQATRVPRQVILDRDLTSCERGWSLADPHTRFGQAASDRARRVDSRQHSLHQRTAVGPMTTTFRDFVVGPGFVKRGFNRSGHFAQRTQERACWSFFVPPARVLLPMASPLVQPVSDIPGLKHHHGSDMKSFGIPQSLLLGVLTCVGSLAGPQPADDARMTN